MPGLKRTEVKELLTFTEQTLSQIDIEIDVAEAMERLKKQIEKLEDTSQDYAMTYFAIVQKGKFVLEVADLFRNQQLAEGTRKYLNLHSTVVKEVKVTVMEKK